MSYVFHFTIVNIISMIAPHLKILQLLEKISLILSMYEPTNLNFSFREYLHMSHQHQTLFLAQDRIFQQYVAVYFKIFLGKCLPPTPLPPPPPQKSTLYSFPLFFSNKVSMMKTNHPRLDWAIWWYTFFSSLWPETLNFLLMLLKSQWKLFETIFNISLEMNLKPSLMLIGHFQLFNNLLPILMLC